MKRFVVDLLLLGVAVLVVQAQESADSLATLSDTIAVQDTIAPRRNLFQRFINYFNESNKPKEFKGFDWSIIGGPHYSGDTKLGIGFVAAGFYGSKPQADTTAHLSDVSLYGDVSTVGFYMVGIRGNHFLEKNRGRVEYNLYFYSFPRKFWGIGYEQGNNMANRSSFNEIFVNASAAYLRTVASNVFLGPVVGYTYAHAARMERPELWDGQPFHTSTYTVGARIQYDSRDNLTSTQSGLLLSAEQRFSPRFLGNRMAFSSTELKMSYFHHLWRGSIFATHYHGMLSYGSVPWAVMPSFGGSNSMRGYYDGRFRDKGEMDLTVELRQHVWRRNGVVVWGGVGTVFPRLSEIRFNRLLPNFGIGYRWEFKQRTNVRLDYGFGKGESSFIFSINEAF